MSHDVDAPDGRVDDAPGQATIGDVAVRAGVSVATVSRALRGLPNVAVSTRKRIERAANDLRYRPDPAAARLAAGRTSTVTIGIPALNNWYFSNAVAGAEAVCTAEGYEVQVVCLGTPDDIERLVDPPARLERRTDALILVDIDLDADRADELRRRGLALGTIGFRLEGCPAVQIDDEAVGRAVAEHLVEIGCRRPAMLAGLPDDPMRTRVPDLRRVGFERALASATPTGEPRIAAADINIDGGRTAMAELLDVAEDERPDGVFAMSDEMAFGAVMELRSRGIGIGIGPGRVALVGVDGHEFAPVIGLTTVHQDVQAHGAVLARRLIDRIAAGRRSAPADHDAPDVPPDVVRPEFVLVRRSSTAPAELN